MALAGCLIAFTCACFAQDVIVTKDARKINAKVTEVNVNDVRYKLFDNPNGSTYMIQKSNIVTILYQNGKVETFETANAGIQATTPSHVQTPNQITTQQNQYQAQGQRTVQSNQYIQYQDVVNLRNGSVLRGVIIEQVPNKSITIETADGSLFFVQMDEIESLMKVPYRGIGRSSSSYNTMGTGLRRGFKGIVEFGYLFGTGDYGVDRLKLNFIFGHQANPYFSFGFGFGLRYYYLNGVVNGYRYYGDETLIPILSDFRVNFLDNWISPYLSVGIGYSFQWNDSYDDFRGVGFLFNPTTGVSFKIANRSALHVGLGYETQRFGNDYYSINSDAINLVFGISF